MFSFVKSFVVYFILLPFLHCYDIIQLPDDLKFLIADEVADVADISTENAKDKAVYLQHLLKRIVHASNLGPASPTVNNLVEVGAAGNFQTFPCSHHLSCQECITNSCAWCISQRACRDDAAWQCQGDIDHVGYSGIGKHTQCPRVEDIDRLVHERMQRKNEAKAFLLKSLNASSTFGDVELKGNDKVLHLLEIEQRAARAAEGYGKMHPYETLNLDVSASNGEIRSAYRKLSLQFHPDKNGGSPKAEEAFRDIVAAYDILGDPEKRAIFDDFGNDGSLGEAFMSEESYHRYGRVNENNFYQGNKLITALTENLWERRVGSGDDVWIIEFYAPWCGACQQTIPAYKEVASAFENEEGVEIGAVNCVSQGRICNEWFGIRAYPTILAVNDKHGTRQEFHGNKDTQSIVAWAKSLAKEWKWLFANSALVFVNDRADFVKKVVEATNFVLVLYLDGLDCSSCKTAKTNALRLSAALKDYPVDIVLVNCEDNSDVAALCYQEQGLPPRPHAPIVRGYHSGVKAAEIKGESLYNSNELEPHVVMQLLEKAMRLTLTDRKQTADAERAQKAPGGEYKADKPEAEDEHPSNEEPPEMLWNGPQPRNVLPWGDGGQGHQGFMHGHAMLGQGGF